MHILFEGQDSMVAFAHKMVIDIGITYVLFLILFANAMPIEFQEFPLQDHSSIVKLN